MVTQLWRIISRYTQSLETHTFPWANHLRYNLSLNPSFRPDSPVFFFSLFP